GRASSDITIGTNYAGVSWRASSTGYVIIFFSSRRPRPGCRCPSPAPYYRRRQQ
ncbi:unnamed protein product, partial [Ectocarpus sp. 12 AP-2014]